MRLSPHFEIPQGAKFNSILVPTIDTVRNRQLSLLLSTRGKHVMLTGDTGTGKSVSTVQLIMNDLDKAIYKPLFINFSAQTSANQTQDTIDSKMEKRRKGYYGPPIGKKCIIFIDDLNMPKKETFGAQPPIELIRQYLDHKGWFDRKTLLMMKLVQ